MGLPSLTDSRDIKKVHNANRLLVTTIELMETAILLGIPVLLENPLSSRLWKCPSILALARKYNAKWVFLPFQKNKLIMH